MSTDAKHHAEPRPSATVVLLRDGPAGPEVYLVLRHSQASFGASYVFPGGLCEDGDNAVAACCDGMDDKLANERLGDGNLCYYSAAIRELFEETGILLARQPGDEDCAAIVPDNAFDDWRDAIHSGSKPWPEFLAEQGLRLCCDRLTYFAWWVTPRHFRKRFTTRFFVARAPEGQAASHDGGELTDSCWLHPAAALTAAAEEEISLPPPTRAVLQDITHFASVVDVLDWARSRQAAGVTCVLPTIVAGDDGERVVLPGDRDYPAELEGQTA